MDRLCELATIAQCFLFPSRARHAWWGAEVTRLVNANGGGHQALVNASILVRRRSTAAVSSFRLPAAAGRPVPSLPSARAKDPDVATLEWWQQKVYQCLRVNNCAGRLEAVCLARFLEAVTMGPLSRTANAAIVT